MQPGLFVRTRIHWEFPVVGTRTHLDFDMECFLYSSRQDVSVLVEVLPEDPFRVTHSHELTLRTPLPAERKDPMCRTART